MYVKKVICICKLYFLAHVVMIHIHKEWLKDSKTYTIIIINTEISSTVRWCSGYHSCLTSLWCSQAVVSSILAVANTFSSTLGIDIPHQRIRVQMLKPSEFGSLIGARKGLARLSHPRAAFARMGSIGNDPHTR